VLDAVDEELRALEPWKRDELREARYAKFRRIGAWEDTERVALATALT
jgi:acetyl-CoA carboxylase alpha subunit